MTVASLFTANGGDGRRIVMAKVQGAEGTIDALTPGTDEKLYDAGTMLKPIRESLSPNIVSPSYPGSRAYTTNEHVEVTVKSRVFGTAIVSADSTDYWHPHELLIASGWELTSDSTDKTHTYVLTANQGGVLSMQQYMLNANNTATRNIHAGDIRGNCVISARYGKEWMCDFTGLGRNNDPSTIRTYDANPWSTVGANLPSGLPFMLRGSSIYVYDQAGAALYAGGSLSSPGTAGGLLEFTLNPGRKVIARGTGSATSGIDGALAELENVTLDLKLEVNSNDLHVWQSQSKALQFRIRTPQPGASGNTATILCYGYITEVADDSLDEGRYIASVKIKLAWPADPSDNAPTAGQNPLSPWKTATNQGVPLMPTSTLPVGIAVIQFATA